ncbi:MAG: phage tail protein [Elusimicrobiota bacterium]
MSVKIIEGRRVDPFRGFKFRVIDVPRRFESAGFTTVSGLNTETEVVEYREGDSAGHMHKLPGLTTFEDITLSRGKSTIDDFQIWRNEVYEVDRGGGLPDREFRRNLIIELRDYQNVPVKSWEVRDAWATRLEHGDLDATSSDVWIETLVLAHEGLKALNIQESRK